MARNFPNSPVVDQVFEGYVWDGQAWKSLQTLPGGVPAGTIVQWGGATVPSNWLLCDGQVVSRSTYASLFAAIGTAYGAGNGTTTFQLPDLRGRIPVGKNGGSFGTLGATGGVESVTLTAAQSGLPAHTHTFSATTNTTGAHTHSLNGKVNISQNGYGQNSPINGNAGNFADGTAYSSGDHSHTVSGTTASSTAADASASHTNLQPYQVVNYIIKATAAASLGDSELAVRVGAAEATIVSHTSSISTINSTARTVAQGGTGQTSLTAGAYLKGNGTTAITLQTGVPIADVSGSLPVLQGGTGTTTGSGLVPIIPSSVTVSSGSGSVNSLGVVSFSGVGAITLKNVFSSTYEHYKFVMTLTNASNDADMQFQLGKTGLSNLSASYVWGRVAVYNGPNWGPSFNNAANGGMFARISAGGGFSSGDITGAGSTKRKAYNSISMDQDFVTYYGGRNSSATAYEDIYLYLLQGGTFTGTFQIYGYR